MKNDQKWPSNDFETIYNSTTVYVLKNHQKLSTFLSSNSYNFLSIDEKSIEIIKNDQKWHWND